MNVWTEAKKGFMEGVKQIPGKLRSTQSLEFSPVSKYATNPFSSPNISAKKWKNNINARFRREAAGEIKRALFSNNTSPPPKHTNQKPILAKVSPLGTPYIPKPSPYLLQTPLNYRPIPSNTTPREPEMRGGYRKTRKVRKFRRGVTRRFVKPKILRY
jgi:hypothetical protein